MHWNNRQSIYELLFIDAELCLSWNCFKIRVKKTTIYTPHFLFVHTHTPLFRCYFNDTGERAHTHIWFSQWVAAAMQYWREEGRDWEWIRQVCLHVGVTKAVFGSLFSGLLLLGFSHADHRPLVIITSFSFLSYTLLFVLFLANRVLSLSLPLPILLCFLYY